MAREIVVFLVLWEPLVIRVMVNQVCLESLEESEKREMLEDPEFLEKKETLEQREILVDDAQIVDQDLR